MNKFKFRGVGQGLFYTGSLMHGTYNFVFDCGSSSRELYLNKQIDEYVHELSYNRKIKPNIDFMVVSHFHKDHINGIFTLLNECNVKKLYLPYLMGDDTFKKFVLAYISFYDFEGKNQKRNDEDNDGDNIDKRYMLYKRLKSLYGIDEKQLDIDTQVVIAGMDDATPPIEFCVPNNQNKYWEFKIFHRHLDEKIIIELNFEIKSLMQRCGYTNFNDKEIISFILDSKDKINKLAKEYESIFGRKNKNRLQGGLNISSLVLVHYPLYHNSKAYYPRKIAQLLEFEYYFRDRYRYCRLDAFYEFNNKKITVLTGDAVLDDKFTQVMNFINDEENMNNILLLQVPHHGSLDNWIHVKRLNLRAIVYILSFGLGNSFGHPNAKTICDLEDKHYYCVTQEQSFEYIFD